MDIAYDHIQEENLPDHEREEAPAEESKPAGLNTEFQEAYKAFSSSPWGSRIGGFLGNVRKQGESYYEDARKDLGAASTQATNGINALISKTTALSQVQSELPPGEPAGPAGEAPGTVPPTTASSSADTTTVTRDTEASGGTETSERPDSLPADILHEAESMLARFRVEASKRMKDIERAEDRADEAILNFGSSVRDFLKEAVTIAAPEEDGTDGQERKKAKDVLFDNMEEESRRVFHATRLEARLHSIHTKLDSFLENPAEEAYDEWIGSFKVDEKTEDIANDLDAYPELRKAMEACVPERVDYATFWSRYYYLRNVVQTEEDRRKELLKGAVSSDNDMAWDSESDDEPEAIKKDSHTDPSSSTTTLQPPRAHSSNTRRSPDQHSQADSDASYDLPQLGEGERWWTGQACCEG
ncbi:BSD-domain-containing protein [Eremomyces bilateralis CBS 781.70]|uniref:BSD-domain-containing protein n=1 Tax=Eremomyces bilateralis CBS 781.70 TaxID=1392243 RepID=A0A6G1FVK3_9PEZI|nr:BSD-domain-containing protein [Eremomyces bilateralis CBS 781.70]KAF1809712.1 BSD-domain-containing protein [Eremomyces bilateralis CBS 781.70]